MPVTSHSTSPNDDEVSVEVQNGFTFNNDCGYLGVGRSGLVQSLKNLGSTKLFLKVSRWI